MKIRFAVDQAEALRRGIDAPKPSVLIEVDPAKLSPFARDMIADNLVKGHDLTGCKLFHLINSTEEEFNQKIAEVDSIFEEFRKSIFDDVAEMAKNAATGPTVGRLKFAVARYGQKKIKEPEVTDRPWAIRGRCAFWPYFDCTPTFSSARPLKLKEKFAEELLSEALSEAAVKKNVAAVTKRTNDERLSAYHKACSILEFSDATRIEALSKEGVEGGSLDEYISGNTSAWSLDQCLNKINLPGWTNWPAENNWVFPIEWAGDPSKEVSVALTYLPESAQVWICEDIFNVLLDRDNRYALAAWKNNGFASFAVAGMPIAETW